jgi:glutamine synthetase
LDQKTPLLRSQEAINKEGIRLLRNIGDKHSKFLYSKVGWEQEFFVISREHYLKRPDLISSGRTLFGSLQTRGQQTNQNYFALIPPRIRYKKFKI